MEARWRQVRGQIQSLARRMDWYRGLRAATALSTPLLLADVTGFTHLGWAALGGIEAIVTDAGGPYRSRLGRLTVLSLGGALAVFLGTLAGNDIVWALPVTVLFCFTWSYLAVLGQPFTSAGLLVQVIYACGIGDPDPSGKEALLRAGFLLAGGAWAMILSLFLWPIDPYRPARLAASKCYVALGAFLESIAQAQARPAAPDAWDRTNAQHKIQLRRLIELAWDAAASVRSESPAETAQGRHLIVLLETVDLVLERTVALAELTVAIAEPTEPLGEITLPASPSASIPASPRSLASHLHQLHEAAQWVSALLIRSKRLADPNQLAVHTMLARLAASSRTEFSRQGSEAQLIAQHVIEIASNLDTAVETTTALRLGSVPAQLQAAPPQSSASHPRTRIPRPSWALASIWHRLEDNWRPESLLLRHAARVAIVCGFDICLIERRHFGHGYWLLMTSIIVLQPHVSGTLRRSLQRVGGTVGGGILAAILAITLHSQLVTGIVLFPMALLALALLPVNYAAFSFFLTPTFVLAYLRHPGDWQLAELRVGNTIAGAAISIAAMTVLFPSFERERIASFLRASLIANRRYLEQLIESWTSGNRRSGETAAPGDPDIRPLALARRATGLAMNDVEESLERVLAESWARKTSAETLLAFAAYLHRFSQTVTSLATLPDALEWKQSAPVQAHLAAVHERLLHLETYLEHPASAATPSPDTRPLPGTPSSPQAGLEANPPGHRQVLRLERQTVVLERHLESMRNEHWLFRT